MQFQESSTETEKQPYREGVPIYYQIIGIDFTTKNEVAEFVTSLAPLCAISRNVSSSIAAAAPEALSQCLALSFSLS